MHLLLSAIAGIFAATFAASSSDLNAWHEFKTKYSKEYPNETEESRRMDIFLRHRKQIDTHNELYDQGLSSFKMGLNKYSDLGTDEFSRSLNGLQVGIFRSIREAPIVEPVMNTTRKSIDWRQKGAVIEEVQVTVNCTSWAFAGIGSIESQRYLKKVAPLERLSVQNIIDCATDHASILKETKYSSLGCKGGRISDAFKYVKEHGIDTEEAYPYKGEDKTCKYTNQKSNITIRDFVYLNKGDEKSLQDAILNIGPIAAGIDASQPSFVMYAGGIYDDSNCTSQINHAVLIVGFESDSHGIPYYIVKNFWSNKWGESGYMKLRANQNNLCSIASHAFYAIP